MVAFAIFDKTRGKEGGEGELAGMLGYTNTSPENLSTEIAFVLVLPPYRHTHVTSNAVGLLMHYALDLPSPLSGPGGLGLRRVVWQANAVNEASIRAAERMGFRMEGIKRWDRVFHDGLSKGKVGNGRDGRVGEGREGDLGRDTAVLAICWDDWEGGGRERVDGVMNRRK